MASTYYKYRKLWQILKKIEAETTAAEREQPTKITRWPGYTEIRIYGELTLKGIPKRK